VSAARVIRYIVGVIVAAILLAIALPVVGVPSSRFLPPAHVWDVAKGYAKGEVTDKFYAVTGNPFNVGGHLYYVDYGFYGKAPQSTGQAPAKHAQLYYGKVAVNKNEYDAVQLSKGNITADKAYPNQKIPVMPGQFVRVKYEPTAPEINGTQALSVNGSWVAWGGRSIAGAANLWSGWLVWVAVALALGYGLMLLLERFGGRENI